MQTLDILLWATGSFILGSIPFSILLVRLFTDKDVRDFGDGNPGAHNARLSGGWIIGILVGIMDVCKGFLPVYLAQNLGYAGSWMLFFIALAPILGHIFSPFLHMRGGKAVATTLGVWLALRGFPYIIAFAIFCLTSMLFIRENAWNVQIGILGFFAASIYYQEPLWLIMAILINLALLVYSHRKELTQPVQLSNSLIELFIHRRNS